jgi:hypothetical protein
MVTEAWNPVVRAKSWIQPLWRKQPKFDNIKLLSITFHNFYVLHFQICVSFHMCLVTVYYVVSYWYYPLKNILGDTGCHIANILRETGTLQIQLHSFIMATTRYIFLFHENLLLRFNLTTNVSAILFHIFDFNPIWTGVFSRQSWTPP